MDARQVLELSQPAYRPFDNLPNELLALILTWTSCVLEKDKQRFKFPLTVPQLVSRRWKDVALTTPSLWTTLQVHENMPDGGLRHYLQRSGSMTFNLEVFDAGPPPALVSSSDQWARVTLWSDSQTGVDEIIEKISPRARSLLKFSCIFPPYPFNKTHLAKIRSLCPNLESLHLTHVLPNWANGPLSFRDLTELVLRGKGANEEVDSNALLETLRASPRLRHLELFNIVVPEEDLIPPLLAKSQLKAVQLHSMVELVLTHLYITEFLFFASQINCPNLQSLGVGLIQSDMYNQNSEAEWSPFSPLYPHLQRLDLWSLKVGPEQLRLALRNITSISYLAIRGAEMRYVDLHLSHTFSNLSPTIHTLKTHDVDVPTLYLLFNHFFPRIETIYMHWKDAKRINEAGDGSVGLTSVYGKLPKVVLWGEGEEDVWFLEGVDERDERISHVFRTSLTER